jgi:hypothetical protein
MIKESITSNQQVMQRLFLDWKSFPINSMIPKIFYYKDNPTEPEAVVFLILGDDYMVSDFKLEPPGGSVIVETNISLKKNVHKIGRDLVIRFDFLYPTGHPVFEATVYGDDPPRQREFCAALVRVDKLYVFVANQKFKLIKAKELAWNPTEHQEIYDILGR